MTRTSTRDRSSRAALEQHLCDPAAVGLPEHLEQLTRRGEQRKARARIRVGGPLERRAHVLVILAALVQERLGHEGRPADLGAGGEGREVAHVALAHGLELAARHE